MHKPSQKALEAHDQACRRGESGYVDPSSGFFVMTSVYLLGRKTCCGNGCRHCPWPADVQRDAGRPDVPCFPWTDGDD